MQHLWILTPAFLLTPRLERVMFDAFPLVDRAAFRSAATHSSIEQFKETDDSYHLSFAIPGLRASDVSASIDRDGAIRIVGETKNQYRKTRIARSVLVPADADHETVSVALIDGMLTVTASKMMAEPRDLSVTSDDGNDEIEDGSYRTALLVPGMRAKDVKVRLERDGSLLAEGMTPTSSRLHRQTLKRRLKLPRDADVEATRCVLADGVLMVLAPKRSMAEQQETRELPIQTCLPGECE
jgi:HSP20 family molecular chaperone IbpA